MVLNTILEALRDRDTDIRWAGAKGVGRIVSRLPKELADDVLCNIIKFNFNLHSGNAAWHGGCLAVAELARRGFLPLERLSDVVGILLNVSWLQTILSFKGIIFRIEFLFNLFIHIYGYLKSPKFIFFHFNVLFSSVLHFEALVFEEPQGHHALGASVRDAACYICWSLARSFRPTDLKKFVEKIATRLVCIALFDREVNVRR